MKYGVYNTGSTAYRESAMIPTQSPSLSAIAKNGDSVKIDLLMLKYLCTSWFGILRARLLTIQALCDESDGA